MENDNLKKQLVVMVQNNTPAKLSHKEHSHPAAYVLLHVESSKVYVGSTGNLYDRISQHKHHLQENTHRNSGLQEAFNSDPNFGLAFRKTETKEEALILEQQIIDKLLPSKQLFNISTDVTNSFNGLIKSPETIEKIRQNSLKQFESIEARELRSKQATEQWVNNREQMNLAAKKRAEKPGFKEKISQSVKEKWKDPEYRAKTMANRKQNAVSVHGNIYPSANAAARELNITECAIRYRCKKNQDNCFFIKDVKD